ncbi:unnamed protein product [Musa acuminata subsp. burmannicoides]
MAVPTAAAGDADEWIHDACLHPHLVAAVLLSFRRRSRLDSETECDEKPSTSATPVPTALLEWGRKRSRMMRLPRTLSWTMGEEEEVAAAAAKRKGKRRASPQSPLEGYSSASASGGDDGARAPGSACLAAATPDDRLTKVVGNPRAPSVSSIPASSSIQRPPSKKMTKPELQAVERTLLEERAKLHKEMEDLRRAVEVLRADNCKMQMHLESPKIPVKVHVVLEDVQLPGICQHITPSSLPGRKDCLMIPDLNDPLPDC